MLLHSGSDNAGRHERESNNRNGVHYRALGYNIHNYKPKNGMTVVKVVAYMFGVGGSGVFFYLRVGGGWKADVLWLVLAGFWFVQTLRACVKLYFEYRNEKIESKEKESRYNKDIFT